MDKLGGWILPGAVAVIVLFGIIREIPVFEAFLKGAKEGLRSSISILPTLVGLMMGVTMLQASGALDLISSLVRPLAASLFQTISPDSFPGRVISVLMGSTETTFYAVAVYYGAVGIKKTRWTIPAALTGDMVSMAAAALTVMLFMGK